MLEVYAQGMLPPALPDTLSEAKPNFLPALRHRGGLDVSRLAAGEEDPAKIMGGHVPFSEDLLIGVVFDTEHSMASISPDEFQKWQITPEEGLVIAVENLRHKSPARFSECVPGLFKSEYGDYYDAARVLVNEHIHQLALPGSPVAMVPNRSHLLVTSDRNSEAQAAMVRVAEHVLTQVLAPM